MGEGVGGGRSLVVFDHTSSYQSEVKNYYKETSGILPNVSNNPV